MDLLNVLDIGLPRLWRPLEQSRPCSLLRKVPALGLMV